MAGFDIEGALKAGYTKEQIAKELAANQNFDYEAASRHYTQDEILNLLANRPVPSSSLDIGQPKIKQKESPYVGGLIGGGVGAAYGIGELGLGVTKNAIYGLKSHLSGIEKELTKEAKTAATQTPKTTTPVAQGRTIPGASGAVNYTRAMADLPDVVAAQAQTMDKVHPRGAHNLIAQDLAAQNRIANLGMGNWQLSGSGENQLMLSPEASAQRAAGKIGVGATPQQPQPNRWAKVPLAVKSAASKLNTPSAAAAGHLTTRFLGPGIGLYGSGEGAAQAYNRLTDEDATGQEKIAGGLNLAAVPTGFLSLMAKKRPGLAVLGAGASNLMNRAADWIAKQGAPEEEKATGGAINGYAKGKAVKSGLEQLLSLAKRPAHEAADEVKKLSDVAQGHIGRFYVPTQADRMGGVGGPSYSANQLLHPEYQGLAWGSGQPATATGLANLARDPRFGGPEGQIFAPLLGAENMHQSNQMVFDALANQFYKNRKNLTPEMRKAINEYMQTGGTISGKKAGFEGYPEFDIANQDMVRELGKTFEARKQIAQHAFGGQGLGGRKAQIIPYEEILRKTRDPLTEGAETFSMGPRAFQLTGEVHPAPRPDLNPAYPFQLHGSDIGAAYTPVPSELALMDFQRGWRQNTGKNMPLKSGKLPQPGYYEHTMGYTPAGSSERIYPRQQITEDWIKELQRSGFKHGGLTTLEN